MSDFQIGDKVVPKMPHPWNEIVCIIADKKDQKYVVSNGRGETQVFEGDRLDFLYDAVHDYVMTQIAVNPELRKKTVFLIPKEKE